MYVDFVVAPCEGFSSLTFAFLICRADSFSGLHRREPRRFLPSLAALREKSSLLSFRQILVQLRYGWNLRLLRPSVNLGHLSVRMDQKTFVTVTQI
jgi:hypothetical protein